MSNKKHPYRIPVVFHCERFAMVSIAAVVMSASLTVAATEDVDAADLPSALQAVAVDLQSDSPARRTTAAFRLAQMAPRYPQVESLLLQTLDDHVIVPQWQHPEQPWVHRVTSPGREAARGLLAIGANEELLTVLGSGSREARQNAAWALAALGDQRAVPVILSRLWNPGFIEALGVLADPRGVQPLISELGGNRAFEAARALRKMGSVAEPKLIEALRQQRGQIRNQAADILGRLGSQAAGEALVEAAREGSLEAGEALLRIDPIDRAAAMFTEKLNHEDWRWRRTALAGLIHSDADIDPAVLAERLNDSDNTVRGYAARAAGELQVDSVVDAVAGQLTDDSRFARQSAMAALAALGDPRAMPAIDELLATGGKSEKRKAVGWLQRISNDEAMTQLAGLLADHEARDAARRALLEIGEPAIPHVRNWLIEMARSKHVTGGRKFQLAGVGCGLLAAFGEPALPALIALLDHDWRLQSRAHEALAKITGRQFDGGWQERTPRWKRWWQENQPSAVEEFMDNMDGDDRTNDPPGRPDL